MEAKSEVIVGSLLLLVAVLLVNAPNCHLSLVLAMQSTATEVMETQVCNIFLSKLYEINKKQARGE